MTVGMERGDAAALHLAFKLPCDHALERAGLARGQQSVLLEEVVEIGTEVRSVHPVTLSEADATIRDSDERRFQHFRARRRRPCLRVGRQSGWGRANAVGKQRKTVSIGKPLSAAETRTLVG